MARTCKRTTDFTPQTGSLWKDGRQWALALPMAIGLCLGPISAPSAFADRDTPQFHSGACTGAYPGWLRGVSDGYNNLTASPVENPTSVLIRVPTPDILPKGDARLGFGDGLQEGFKLGVAYGAELAKASRTRQSPQDQLVALSGALKTYMDVHCVTPATALDWETTFLNDRGTATIASLNEALVAMHLAVSANQLANAAEDAARSAQEAQARGDQPAVQAFLDAAKLHARTAADFADLAKSHAAAGREEATQAIMDAQSSAERARKAVDDIGN